MAQRRLSGLDTVFLAAESPGSWLHIMAILLLDPSTVPGGYAYERYREDLGRRLRLVPPLRRRLVEVPLGLANPVWVDVPDVDLDRHLRRAALPAPGGPRELAALAAEMLERPLDRRRPLWEIVVVEGVSDGRIALLAKLHHSMMDGMAGMQFMASLLTRDPAAPAPTPPARGPAAAAPGPWSLLGAALPSIATRPLRLARASSRTLGAALRGALRRDATDAREDADAPRVERCWLNAPIGPERSVAFTSLSLDAARSVARAAGATVNDVVLAVVGGALRREMIARGVLPDTPLVAAVPVSTHEAAGDDLANAITLVFVGLGTDEPDPVRRLGGIRDAAGRARQRRGHGGGDALGAWAEVPRPWEMTVVARLALGAGLMHRMPPLCHLVVSNVPGPPVPLHLGGARLVGIHPLGPIFDGIGLNVTVLGREDRWLDFGLVALGSLIRDPWPLADALTRTLDELVDAARSGALVAPPTPDRPDA